MIQKASFNHSIPLGWLKTDQQELSEANPLDIAVLQKGSVSAANLCVPRGWLNIYQMLPCASSVAKISFDFYG